MSDATAPSVASTRRFADLGKRIITGAALAVGAAAAIYFGFPFIDGLVALGAALGLMEWTRLCGGWREPGWTILGIAYLAAGAVALLWIRHDVDRGMLTCFWLFATVMATDIFAYFGGRAIGGPKLVPWISPNKTWAGLASAMVAAALVGLGFALAMGTPPLEAGLWGGFLAAVAQAGDIFESGLKRYFGAKDSGKLLPGHGGILDRIDGLLAASIVVAALRLLGQKGMPWQ